MSSTSDNEKAKKQERKEGKKEGGREKEEGERDRKRERKRLADSKEAVWLRRACSLQASGHALCAGQPFT